MKPKTNPLNPLNASGIPRRSASAPLVRLFENGLKDMYWTEKALSRTVPVMIKHASSEALVDALEIHLDETLEQVSRVEQVFETIGKRAVGKKCKAMEGIIRESREIMEECEAGAMCDAGIIAASQKIGHYEIASYGTLRRFAESLGYVDAANLLETTLKEEKNAEGKLSYLASKAIQISSPVPVGAF